MSLAETDLKLQPDISEATELHNSPNEIVSWSTKINDESIHDRPVRIVYFSRTGHTFKVDEKILAGLCKQAEIVQTTALTGEGLGSQDKAKQSLIQMLMRFGAGSLIASHMADSLTQDITSKTRLALTSSLNGHCYVAGIRYPHSYMDKQATLDIYLACGEANIARESI